MSDIVHSQYNGVEVTNGDVGLASTTGGPVAPDPASTTLFLIGSAALGARNFREQKI